MGPLPHPGQASLKERVCSVGTKPRHNIRRLRGGSKMGIAHAAGGFPGGGGPGGGFTAFIPLLLMFAVFYLLLIRPQQKKQRELSGYMLG